jgi:glycosyltransferase involved in cell wall biosynthesis
MKLAAYAIAKNESNRVSQFVQQTQLFDHVTVLDTGSTDDTVALLTQAGITVHNHMWAQFDFSAARNMCAQLTPTDCDWLMSVDFSDQFELTPEIKHEILHHEAHALTVNYLSSDHPDYLEHKVRIHRRGHMMWHHAVHEQLHATHESVTVGHLNWCITKQVHMPMHKRKWYTEICEREHVKHPQDPHYSWWALDYYKAVQDVPRMQYYAHHYLNHTPAYALDFRVHAWLALSTCAQHSDWTSAVDHAMRALSESLAFRHQVPQLVPMCLKRLQDLGVHLHVQPP